MLLRQQEAEKSAKTKMDALKTDLAGGMSVGASASGAAAPGAGGEDVDMTEFKEDPLWRRCLGLFTGRGAVIARNVCLVMVQCYAIFGLFVEASEDADSSVKTVAGILGTSSLLAVFVAPLAIFAGRKKFLNLYIICQIWVCAMAAVFLGDSLQDVYKQYAFCRLEGVGGLPDSGCSLRERRAEGKVFYSLCTAFISIVLGTVASNTKDEVFAAEMAEFMKTRGGLLAMRGSVATSRSFMSPSKSIKALISGGSGVESASKWRSKKWSKASPSAKKALQMLDSSG